MDPSWQEWRTAAPYIHTNLVAGLLLLSIKKAKEPGIGLSSSLLTFGAGAMGTGLPLGIYIWAPQHSIYHLVIRYLVKGVQP